MATRPALRRKATARVRPDPTGDLFAPPAPPPAVAAAVVPQPRSAAPPRQLWLAVQFTALPLVVAPQAPGPQVVVDGDGAARTLVACNAAAMRGGLMPGLALNAARARLPDLQILARDARREQRQLAALARWALGLTPLVSVEPPDALLLEVRGSLRLYGGLEPLLQRAAAGLREHGHPAVIGVAPTPRAALWLARAAPSAPVESAAGLVGALARLPLGVTQWPARVLEDCTRLGVTTLGELHRLPREGLARRFTPALVAELDEAYGLRPSPRRRYVAPERFEQRLDLPVELVAASALLPYCAHLLAALEAYLRARAAATPTLAFTLLHRDQPPTCLRLGRALPVASADDWLSLLRERLGRVALVAPVRALALRSGATVPAGTASGELDGCGGGATQAAAAAFQLLDRLRARLGEEAISGVCLVPEHRPEGAFRHQRPGSGTLGVPTPRQALPVTPRPLWLLATPEPLPLRGGRPHYGGALSVESGPERIESSWWEGAAVMRDYYVACTARGVRLWLYRERDAAAAAAAAPRWFLHGVFG